MKDLDFSTYSHDSQRKKRWPKERNDYYYSFNQLNPEGTDHLLLKGDILTSYEQLIKKIFNQRGMAFIKKYVIMLRLFVFRRDGRVVDCVRLARRRRVRLWRKSEK